MQKNSHKISGHDVDVVTRTEQVNQLLHGIPATVVSCLLLALISTLVLWNSVPHSDLLIWVAVFVAIVLSYFWLWHIGKHALTHNTSVFWRTLLRLAVLVIGITWGMLPVFLFPNDLPHQLFLPFVASGMTAAAIAALAADRVSAQLFLFPMLIPLIMRLFVEGGEIPLAMAAMIVLYLLYLLIVSYRNEQAFRDMQALREQVSLQNVELRKTQRLARLGSWKLDIKSGDLQWSDEVYSIYGRDPLSFTPELSTYYKELVHPADLADLQLAEQAAYRIPGQLHSIDHRIIMPNGDLSWVHVDGMAITDSNGQQTHLVGTVQDITERKQNEVNLVSARDAADHANNAKSEFLTSMNHELRTPMNAILGYSQLLKHENTLSVKHKGYAQEILNAGKHLLQLINEVLDLSKVESGSIKLSLEAVAVHDLVYECLHMVKPLADKRNIAIHRLGLQLAVVRADRTRLKQVLLNLLSNAIKYNHEAGSVTLELRMQDPQHLRILVTDSGPGIPANRLSELFMPFNRLGAENTNIEGTGIGLTITRRMVEMMGGSVDVISEVGIGSTFWIDLPIEPAGDNQQPVNEFS